MSTQEQTKDNNYSSEAVELMAAKILQQEGFYRTASVTIDSKTTKNLRAFFNHTGKWLS